MHTYDRKPFASTMTGTARKTYHHRDEMLISKAFKFKLDADSVIAHTQHAKDFDTDDGLYPVDTPSKCDYDDADAYPFNSNHLSFTKEGSLSPSPFESFQSYVASDSDSDCESERDHCSFVYPKYDTGAISLETSNISSIATRSRTHSARSSASGVTFYNEISTNLIYDNMAQVTPPIPPDEDHSFNLIESDDEDLLPFYDEETEDELETLLSAPQLHIIDSDIVTDEEEEMLYDEDGDHSILIPPEFRTLNLNICRSSTYDDRNNIFDVCSDTETEDDKPRRNSVPLTHKIKKHTPAKHIQQKIQIHEAIKQLKLEDVVLHFSGQTVDSDAEDAPSTFMWSQHTNEFEEYLSDEEDEEKHFDWSVHPNEIRLSDEACHHLVSLMEYQTDDDSI
eukprot:238157_1